MADYRTYLNRWGLNIPSFTQPVPPYASVTGDITNDISRINAAGMQAPEKQSSGGILSPLIWVLNQIDRPRNAIVNAIEYGLDGGNPLEGLGRGFTRDDVTSMSDILKDHTSIDSPLLRGVLGFVGDVALDPTTYMTFGLGSAAKGLVKGTAENLTKDAATSMARDAIVDNLGKVMQTSAAARGFDNILPKTVAGADDIIRGLQKAGENPQLFEDILGKLTGTNAGKGLDSVLKDVHTNFISGQGDEVLKGLGKNTDYLNAIQNGVTGYMRDASTVYGEKLASDAARMSTGLGMHIPFTKIGGDVVSGETMQNLGVKLRDALSPVNNVLTKAPVVGKGLGAVEQWLPKAFDKYYMKGAKQSAKQYLRSKDIARTGLIDLSNTQEWKNLVNVSDAKYLDKYTPDVENVSKLWATDKDAAMQYLANMEDGPVKQLLIDYGQFEGQPLRNINLKDYTEGVNKNVFTVLDEDEMDKFLEQGATGMTKQGVRLHSTDINDALQQLVSKGVKGDKELYLMQVDNLSSKATSAFDKLSSELARNPEFKTTAKVFQAENTRKIWKLDLGANNVDDMVKNMEDVSGDYATKLSTMEGKGGKARYLKPEDSYINLSNVKNGIKVGKDGTIFVPQLDETGRMKQGAYDIFKDGNKVGAFSIPDTAGASLPKSLDEAARSFGTEQGFIKYARQSGLDTIERKEMGAGGKIGAAAKETVQTTTRKLSDDELALAYDAVQRDMYRMGELTPGAGRELHPSELADSSVQAQGFKDLEDFRAAKPGNSYNFKDLKEVWGELQKGMKDGGKWDAVTQILENPEKLYANLATNEEKSLRAVGVMLMGNLKRAGMDEKNLNLLGNVMNDYMPHALSWDTIEKGPLAKGGLTGNDSIVNFNSFAREYRTSITEANKIMEAQGYGKNYFETNFAKAYLTRMLRHNKVVYDNQFIERLLNDPIIGKDVAGMSEEQIRTVSKEMGGENVLVVPRASVKIFGLNHTGSDTLDAMLSFGANAENLSEGARVLGGAEKSLAKAVEGIKGIAEELKTMSDGNAEIKQAIDDLLSGDDYSKIVNITRNLNPEDADVLSKLFTILKDVDTTELTKFQRNAHGLRGVLQNINSVEDGGIAVLRPSDYALLGAKVRNIKAYVVPKSVADYINKASRRQLNDGISDMGKMIDSFNAFWKTSVTAVLPSFHLRNWFGGNQQNIFEFGAKALSPRMHYHAAKIAAGAEGSLKLGGKKYTYQELRDLAVVHRVDTPFISTEVKEVAKMHERELERGISKGVKNTLSDNAVMRTARWAGNWVEKDVRMVNFMTWLDEGVDPMIAAERTKLAHFDYTELSDVEKKVFKRVMPFYTFFRKNFPYQLTNLLDKPGTVTGLNHLVTNMSEGQDMDMSQLPDYMRNAMPLPLGKGSNGRDYYANLSLPVNDAMGRSFKDIMSSLNPAVVAAFETVMNQSMLTGKPLEKYAGQSTNIAGLDVNNKLLNIINKLGTGRQATTIGQMLSSEDNGTKTLTSASSYDPTSFFGLIRGYSPGAGQLNGMYEYQRNLDNYIQKLKDQGLAVPTMRDINSNAVSPRTFDDSYPTIKKRQTLISY